MTIFVFIASLLGAMAFGMPIAFALLVCGVALMVHLGNFDTQILAQNMLEGVNNYPLMAVPFFMLRIDRAGQVSKRYTGASGAVLAEAEGAEDAGP